MNKFIGIGRWSKEISLMYTPTGRAVANCTIAIDGINRDDTTFLPVVMWGKTAENVANHSGKGRLVAIEGRVAVRSYDADSGKRYVTEIVAETCKFLDSPKREGGAPAASGGQRDPFQDDGKPIDISVDDIPF